MIQGKKKKDLSIESVMQKISPYEIFQRYMPHSWKLNKPCLSAFRKENTPSMVIGDRNNTVFFIDYGDTSKRGGCFDFVMMLYNISLPECLKKIDEDFQLGKIDNRITNFPEKNRIDKQYSFIQCITRKFTKEELAYWNSYHIDIQELKDNNIYSLKTVYLNRQLINLEELRFGYYYDGKWKIYSPLSDRKKKWLSNVPLNRSWGLENLDINKNTLICKSLKDYIVCRKIYPHVCGVQNESLSAFSQETIEHIKNNSKVIFYGGDSDLPGKKASYIITEKLGYKHINPPDYLLPEIKDFADWGKLGINQIREHLILKKVIDSE